MDKKWYIVRTEKFHSHKYENDNISLNLCGGYGKKNVREHARMLSCHDGACTDVATTIQQD